MRKILFLFALLVPGIALAAQTQMVRLTRFEGKPIVGVAASGSFNVELIRSDRTYAVVEVNAEYEDILLFELDGRGVVTVGFRTNAPLRFENNLVCRARIYLPHPEFIHGSGAASIVCSGGFESNALQIELNGAAKLNGPEIAVTGEVNLQCSGASRMTDAAINCRELNGILNGASKAGSSAATCSAISPGPRASAWPATPGSPTSRPAELRISTGSNSVRGIAGSKRPRRRK